MNSVRSLSGPSSILVLCLLVGGACGHETTAPQNETERMTRAIDRSSVQVGSMVRSWKLGDALGSDHSGHRPTSSRPSRAISSSSWGDECNGLDVTLIIHDLGPALEAEIHFANPNDGPWSGELNLDFAHHDEPSVRHGVVQNVEATIPPGGWQSLYVLMVRPETPGTYHFRAFGISGQAREFFRVEDGTPIWIP